MLSRRRVTSGLLATGLTMACGCPVHARTASAGAGCVLAALSDTQQMYVDGNTPMIWSSGDRDFDRALAESLLKLAACLDVSPGFAFYDDHDGINAYASPAVRMYGADGTVLFGLRLLKEIMARPENPEVAVVTICAHEFGHILQFKHRLMERVRNGAPNVKRTELQADFFAGYFAGIRKKERPSFPAAVGAMTQYGVGDNDFGSPQHHGTAVERGAAFVRGFDSAYRENRPLGDAIQVSINYASTL